MMSVMTASAPRAIADVLLSALPQLSERLAEHRLRRDWAAVAGPEIARRARPGGLRAGVLTLVVDNSPWLHELTLRSAELTARLAARVPGLRALRLQLGPLEGGLDEAEATPRPTPLALSAADRADIDAAAAAITDATVAAAARRLLTTARRFPVARREVR